MFGSGCTNRTRQPFINYFTFSSCVTFPEGPDKGYFTVPGCQMGSVTLMPYCESSLEDVLLQQEQTLKRQIGTKDE